MHLRETLNPIHFEFSSIFVNTSTSQERNLLVANRLLVPDPHAHFPNSRQMMRNRIKLSLEFSRLCNLLVHNVLIVLFVLLLGDGRVVYGVVQTG